MMRRGMMVHVDRLVEAERMNNVVKDTRVLSLSFSYHYHTLFVNFSYQQCHVVVLPPLLHLLCGG
jgi:hypothetical protein